MLQNNSILVEWELEYDGGHPVTLFEVHVILHPPRPSTRTWRATPPPDLVYHTDASARRLVTRAVDTGHAYTVRAIATNLLGPSIDRVDNGNCHRKCCYCVVIIVVRCCCHLVFVGYTDVSTCNFESRRGEDCVWTLEVGVVTRAGSATPPLPLTDATSNAQGTISRSLHIQLLANNHRSLRVRSSIP